MSKSKKDKKSKNNSVAETKVGAAPIGAAKRPIAEKGRLLPEELVIPLPNGQDKGFIIIPYYDFFNGRRQEWEDANNKYVTEYLKKQSLVIASAGSLVVGANLVGHTNDTETPPARYTRETIQTNAAVDIMLWSAYHQKTMPAPLDDSQLDLQRSQISLLNSIIASLGTAYQKLCRNRHARTLVLADIANSEYLEWIQQNPKFKAIIADRVKENAGFDISSETYNMLMFDYLFVAYADKRYDELLAHIDIKAVAALNYMLDSETKLGFKFESKL